MTRYLLLCFLINCLYSSAQKVIVIDLASKNVSVKGTTAKAIRYNNSDETYFQDLLRKNIADMVSTMSSQYDTMYLFKSATLENTLSSVPSKFFNCFNINNKDDAFFPNKKINNKNSFHNNYDGLVLNDSLTAFVKTLLPKEFNYVVILTAYRVYNPNSIFALSADVLDSSFNKTAGFKKEFKRNVSRTSSPELLNYYTKKKHYFVFRNT